ncbi:uncharacterized protein LOC117747574 isoform X2 [Cyclopterus lumpus]|uniref:uncharacterized protein LOC117747574 isoform X2 n=1 Tax=Cyclopterus lumpus TaxID=8103 RepID=UPI001485FA2E|nr:uncharacterized protein LOC117747574 isoform X2 [Cyclopterus lumpus]
MDPVLISADVNVWVMYREKMICCIIRLFTLTSCVSEFTTSKHLQVESKGSCSRWVSSSLSVSSTGSFLVEVTQTSYEAEENNNVTLGWRFSPRTDGSLNSINIFCEKLTHVRTFVLLHLFDGVEVPKSQDERFAGRVQWDKDALREGLVRLQVSRLRTDDSGVYLCDVLTGDGAASRRCNLNVTARDQTQPETPRSGGGDPSQTESPSQPESPGWTVLYCLLGLTGPGTLLGVFGGFYYCRGGKPDSTKTPYEVVQMSI